MNYLTKAPNRLFFDIRLDQIISKAKKNNTAFALFFINLDNFKNINETYRNIARDKVLKIVSSNIKKITRVEDTFVYLGEDEFSLIVEDIVDKNHIDNIANTIVNTAASCIEIHDNNITLTCSVGISKFPQDSESKQALIYLADIAMYRAKKLDKSNYLYFKNEDTDGT